MKNWAGNLRYGAGRVEFPRSVEEVQAIVRQHARVRALGTRHSFNLVADAPRDGVLVSLANLGRVVRVGADTVTVEAGVCYGMLPLFLEGIGRALPNLASLPHIAVAGACATATHGSGDALKCLAASVVGLKIVNAVGEVEEHRRGQAGVPFEAMVVAMGGLGIVVELTLETVETFEVTQRVYEGMTFDALHRVGTDAVTGGAYSVSFFTDFQARRFTQVWVKSRPGERPLDLRSHGTSRCDVQRHPLGGGCAEASLEGLIDADNCTRQGEAGPWLHRLPHFRLDREPSASGQELQAEYVIPRESLADAIEAVACLGPELKDLILISEVRTVAADDLYASPFCRRASACVHFTLRRRQEAVMALLPRVERALQPFAPRPHWGKLFAMPRETLWANYAGAELAEFRALLQQRDPEGKFANAFVREYVL